MKNFVKNNVNQLTNQNVKGVSPLVLALLSMALFPNKKETKPQLPR